MDSCSTKTPPRTRTCGVDESLTKEQVRGVAPLHPRPLFGSNRFPFAFEHRLLGVISVHG
nr:MAG TPA: hypothetical protein [Caudoviricetes sp.]